MKVGGQLHALAALIQGKFHPAPISYEAGWAADHCAHCGEEEERVKPGIEP